VVISKRLTFSGYNCYHHHVTKFNNGLSIKHVHVQGGFVLSADIFRTRGIRVSLDADVRTFWCKNFGFFEIYGMSARTRELNQCGHFEDKKGVHFSRFCADVFNGTVPYADCVFQKFKHKRI